MNEQLPAFLRRRAESCPDCFGLGRFTTDTDAVAAACPACNGTGKLLTGRLELVLHCTWIQDYYVCPRKFWLRYGEMVEGTGPRPALNYGGAVHEALAHRYNEECFLHRSLTPAELEEMQETQMNALTSWFDAHPQPADEWRNAGRAQDLIRAYNETYPAHDWEVFAVEEEFEVEVGVVDPSLDHGLPGFGGIAPVPTYLAGRKDLVVSWHDGLWVVDHKTCSDWGSGDSNSHLDEGRRSFQFRGYAWAEREAQRTVQAKLAELHGGFCRGCGNPIDPEICHCGDYVKEHGAGSGHSPVPMGCTCGYADQSQFPKPAPRLVLPILGTVGNYLVSRKPYLRPPANGRPAAPRNQFHQEAYPFEPSVLDEWRSEFLDIAATILHDWQRGRWATHDTGCGHWGRCEFYDYCEEAPERREAMLSSSLFQPKTFEREL